MSQSSTYFHHEAINGCRTIEQYEDKIKNCGDSSTGLLSLGVDFIKDSKVVVILKSDEELEKCIEWCNSEYGFDGCRDFILDEHEALKNLNGLHIQQSEIDDKLKEIWQYLVDDEWLDRYGNLTKFNISVQSTKIDVEALKALHESLQ